MCEPKLIYSYTDRFSMSNLTFNLRLFVYLFHNYSQLQLA